ncbi:MAG: DUF6716 putative glycosyltransferase [Eggerthellaceae bacterium]|jgi:hypothetical protein
MGLFRPRPHIRALQVPSQLPARPKEPGTFLFLAAYDSMNQPMAALIPALLARGCRVLLVAASTDDSANLYPFADCGVKPIEAGQVTGADLASVDVVVMPPVRMYGLQSLVTEIRRRGLLIVSFATLFSSVVMREYPDLLLCLGRDKFDEMHRNGLAYNMVAVGNPQYDKLVAHRRSHPAPIRRVLIVDQGGYPYGDKGKSELARTLECIARFNPEIEFVIKPRFYRQLKGRSTHAEATRTIDYLSNPPKNLRVLGIPQHLEDILCDFDAMITSWSTAYLDAAMYHLPLILISGLDSVDVFDVRLQRVHEAMEHLAGTGCVHDYHELQEKQVPFTLVDPAYLEREVYHGDTPCIERVIHTIRLAYRKHTVEGRQWCHPFALSYDEFAAGIDAIETEDRLGPHALGRHHYLVQLNEWMQERVYANRCLACPFDLSGFTAYFERSFASEDPQMIDYFDVYLDLLQRAKRRWNAMYDAYFADEDTRKGLATDAVLQDYYFDWLCDKRRYQALADFDGPILAPSSYAYNLSRAEFARGNLPDAYGFLQQFLDAVTAPHVHVVGKDKHALPLIKGLFGKQGAGQFVKFALQDGNMPKLKELGLQELGEDSVPHLVHHVFRMGMGIRSPFNSR